MELSRCPWCGQDAHYQEYHDQEWGVPEHNALKLFEKLILEGAQAGLSWITILRKREHYRRVFHGFDPIKMAAMSEQDQIKLCSDSGIIRNKLKIKSAVNNARAYLAMEKDGINFSEFIWSFVDHQPKQNQLHCMSDAQTQSTESIAMSKALKKRGFSFVGPTICYAYMQSMGLVNDHLIGCHRYQACKKLAQAVPRHPK